MNLTLTTPPADLANLMLQSVCDHLRRKADLSASPVIAPPDLPYILSCAQAAVSYVDGPKSRIRRALLTQTWTATLDGFPPVIEVPLSPIQSVTSVTYADESGVQQTLDPSAYRMSGQQSWQPEISPAFGTCWPSTCGNVSVEFVAGFGDDDFSIPETIKMAIRQLAAHFYMQREPINFGTVAPQDIPFTVTDLLAPWRVYR